ncbi:MAG: hypothetical protein KDA80_05195 [Planctomycetaceae bacterium]|nr:hypothetical protein [Planctomycetaceae bacterium]
MGGFGLADPDHLLHIQDIVMVDQECTAVSVQFEDVAVAEMFEDQVDLGRRPEQFARVWIHTHPGECPQPSGVDIETFARVFGTCDWAVMFILARGGDTYAELRWRLGQGVIGLDVEIDYSQPFASSDHAEWQRLYERHVTDGWKSHAVSDHDWFECHPDLWEPSAEEFDADDDTFEDPTSFEAYAKSLKMEA